MEINVLRKKIDFVDRRILELLNLRANAANGIGHLKKKNRDHFYAPDREKKVLNSILKRNAGPLSNIAIENIYREILSSCRALEKKLTISYLGPEATFTHQAAIKNFGSSVSYLPVKTIADIFTEVEKDRADYGVVPIENSTEGMINHTLDMFIDSDLSICAEIGLKIEQCLLSKPGDIGKVKRIYSFTPPLAQCRNWIEENLPGKQVVEVSSTAEAARSASRDGSGAAIASSVAAEKYGLKIISQGIEDIRENYTRFLVIGKSESGISGEDKTSILVSIKDKVGALHDMLVAFKKYGVNLTKIESRPTKKKAWEYIFFIDFIGHISDKKVQNVLNGIKKSCSYIKVLGSYPRAE